jgi:hypothetical protein
VNGYNTPMQFTPPGAVMPTIDPWIMHLLMQPPQTPAPPPQAPPPGPAPQQRAPYPNLAQASMLARLAGL